MNIPAEKFQFVDQGDRIHDKKFDTKPIGYFKDVWLRFCRNKSSVVAAIIILVLVLYAIFVPIFCETTYSRALTDTTYLHYGKLPPKVTWLGIDGTSKVTLNSSVYLNYKAIGEETGLDPIVEVYRADYEDPTASKKSRFYDVKLDKPTIVLGTLYMTRDPRRVRGCAGMARHAARHPGPFSPPITRFQAAPTPTMRSGMQAEKKGIPKLDKNGEFVSIYRTTTPEDTSYHSLRIAADNDPEKPLAYARVTGTAAAKSYVVRASLYNYFQYRYGFEPAFTFGTDARGQDILTRLAAGARFSFMLAICIPLINLAHRFDLRRDRGLLRRRDRHDHGAHQRRAQRRALHGGHHAVPAPPGQQGRRGAGAAVRLRADRLDSAWPAACACSSTASRDRSTSWPPARWARGTCA